MCFYSQLTIQFRTRCFRLSRDNANPLYFTEYWFGFDDLYLITVKKYPSISLHYFLIQLCFGWLRLSLLVIFSHTIVNSRINLELSCPVLFLLQRSVQKHFTTLFFFLFIWRERDLILINLDFNFWMILIIKASLSGKQEYRNKCQVQHVILLFPLTQWIWHTNFFVNFFGGHKFFSWGQWYPSFGLLVTSALIFKARVDSSLECLTWIWNEVPGYSSSNTTECPDN